MKQVLVKKGKAFTEDIPVPTVSENTVLVRVYYSCISAGTELSAIKSSEEALLKKAIRQPAKIAKVMNHLKKEGLSRTIDKIQGKLEEWTQAGYSASGVVVDAGSDMKDIMVGERVACAGAGIAQHAEYIEVPRNLLVKIPDGVDFASASTVALGSIAMQGVRRADVRLGEYAAVIGLGILGQITVQLLKACGCHVIGADLEENRIQKALDLGLDKGVNSKDEDAVKTASNFSNGLGADAVIITAATSSKEPLSQAFQMCRKKGRVVLVGTVGMEIEREDMYKKELDFLISTSYGPGRYDDRYELKGIDYPYAYVRWTESRNMEEYLKLIADKKINIKPLIEREYKVEEAHKAYEELKAPEKKPLIVLFKYNQEKKDQIVRRIEPLHKHLEKNRRINIGIIGAGTFVKGMHLPNLMRMRDVFNVFAIADKSGSNAKSTAERYGAKYAETDYRVILEDKNTDAVLIATRHNLHARIAMDALNAGKAVFSEKPMAMNEEELNKLVETIEDSKKPYMVGFNRRFSKYASQVKKIISHRINPMIINYQMNAGYIPLDNWVYSEEGGGRIIGEACHIFDLFDYFTDDEVKSISVERIDPNTSYFSPRDNAVITLKYEDGSICNLTYTSLGSNRYPKEFCQIYFDGKIISIDDYKKLEGYGLKLKELRSLNSDKGHFEELMDFAKYSRGEIQSSIPLRQMIHATEISFKVDRLLR